MFNAYLKPWKIIEMEPVKVAGFPVRKAPITFLKKKYARNARGSQCQKDDIAVTTGSTRQSYFYREANGDLAWKNGNGAFLMFFHFSLMG